MFKQKILGKLMNRSYKIPKHLAVIADTFGLEKGSNIYSKRNSVVIMLLKEQIELGLPIMSLYILKEKDFYSKTGIDDVDSILWLMECLKSSELIHKNQVKVSVIGKWYDLPGMAVEEIKQLIAETKDYDRFFLNLCINYSGHSEVIDACRLLLRKLRLGKISIDDINYEAIKDSLYSSYFLPPELVVVTGDSPKIPDMLLWDLPGALLFHLKKKFTELDKDDIAKAIKFFNDYF